MKFQIFKCEVCKKLVWPWNEKSILGKAHNQCRLNQIKNETLSEVNKYGVNTPEGQKELQRGILRCLFADSQVGRKKNV